MSAASGKRIAKELRSLRTKGCPAGINLESVSDEAVGGSGGALPEWVFSLKVLGDSVFEGEEFRVLVKFDNRYPFECPEVTFVTTPPWKAPMHPHIYTNGHICANILGDEWSPVLSVEAILITLQSMLASCKASIPPLIRPSVAALQMHSALNVLTRHVQKKELPPGNDRYVRTAPSNPKKTRWAFHDDTC